MTAPATPKRKPEPSEHFVRLTRNPDLDPPTKVVRTEKKQGEIVI